MSPNFTYVLTLCLSIFMYIYLGYETIWFGEDVILK